VVAEAVLVTGGAGFIGSHLVDDLVAGGRAVGVLDVLEPQVHGESHGYRNSEAEYVEGSVLDRDLVAAALEGAAAVVHLAAQVGVGQSMYEMAGYVPEVLDYEPAVSLPDGIKNLIGWLVTDAPPAEDKTQRSTAELAARGLVL
jgi:nucleoside-diphosphate-sugar epimerase